MFTNIVISLWAFLIEIFINNDEVKEKVKKPSFLAKSFFLIVTVVGVIGFFYETVGSLLFKTNTEYRTISKDYFSLNEKYRTLIISNTDLELENRKLKEKILVLKVNIDGFKIDCKKSDP